jgi:hypothetical protein
LNDAIHQFLTFEAGSPRTSGLVVDRRGREARLSDEDICKFCAAVDVRSGVSAFGKVALLTDNGIETFQVTAQGGLTPVFCGNSTAAVISHIGLDLPKPLSVRGPACEPYEVTARIADGAVLQTWAVLDSVPTELVWNGRRAVLLHCLNDYAIIEGPLPERYTPEQARRELLGPGAGGKLAVVHGSQSRPEVEFHNSNGRHGAAPQTGLASIALAARRSSWLADCFSGGMISFRAHGEQQHAALPAIVTLPSGQLQFDMSAIQVALSPVARFLAA